MEQSRVALSFGPTAAASAPARWDSGGKRRARRCSVSGGAEEQSSGGELLGFGSSVAMAAVAERLWHGELGSDSTTLTSPSCAQARIH
jgi:hypothetical protein